VEILNLEWKSQNIVESKSATSISIIKIPSIIRNSFNSNSLGQESLDGEDWFKTYNPKFKNQNSSEERSTEIVLWLQVIPDEERYIFLKNMRKWRNSSSNWSLVGKRIDWMKDIGFGKWKSNLKIVKELEYEDLELMEALILIAKITYFVLKLGAQVSLVIHRWINKNL
jgi:hypothetical protein